MSPLLERALLVALSLASFAGTASAVRAALAPPALAEGYEKLDWLERELASLEGGVTALIAGSSAMYRGLDPGVLDAVVRAGGTPDFASFNVAARGARGYEADLLLQRAAEIVGDDLRYVVVEPASWVPEAEEGAIGTERETDWHDLARTRAVVHVALDPLYGEDVARTWVPYHLAVAVQRLGNVGTGARLWATLTGGRLRAYTDDGQIRAGRGYLSIEDSRLERAERRREKFQDRVPDYLASIAAQGRDEAVYVFPHAVDVHRAQRERCEALGAEVVWLMPPYGAGGRFARFYEQAGEAPGFVDFVDPEAYPELFDVSVRIDEQHLDAAGAALLSRLAGERIAEVLRERREARE